MLSSKKKILITGGSKGIGLELTDYFVKKKFNVSVLSRSFEDKDLKKKINFIRSNVLKNNNFRNLRKKLKKIDPDIIIHCIGGGLGVRSTLSPTKEWNKVFYFNVGHAIEINNFLLPEIIKKNKKCNVLHISSNSTLDYGPDIKKYGGAAPYICSKSFLNSYVKIAAKEYKNTNISFTAFLPGPILLRHKYWYDLKIKNPKIFNEFKSDYLRGRDFLSPKKVAKKIISCYEKSLQNYNGLLIEIKN
jgi:3-oxoacyl-[acyl-carrier protein] reductase